MLAAAEGEAVVEELVVVDGSRRLQVLVVSPGRKLRKSTAAARGMYRF